MQPRLICLASLATALILCSSCSKNEPEGSERYAPNASSSPPDIAPSAAPGVAFNYAYDFNLADERISATQEAHAGECEKLGLMRCRITGMSYSVDQNEQVTAELDVKLDPTIARQFGKSALQLVERNDGKLIRLNIGSSDEGEKIEQATKQKNDVGRQISQLEQELAKTKPGTAARSNLQSQIQELQRQSSVASHAIEESQATLAVTPMEFHYYGRGGVPGFRENPIRGAWQTFVIAVVWLTGALLQALAVLVPLSVLAALFIALWRTRPMRAVRSWIKGPEESDG